MFGICRLKDRVDRHAELLDNHNKRVNYELATVKEVGALRHEIRALAAALGYEWVPEGKTEARWEPKVKPWLRHLVNAPPLDLKPVCSECFKALYGDGKKVVAQKKGGRK